MPLYGNYVIYAKCRSKKVAVNYVFTAIIYAFFEAGLYKGSTDLAIMLCSIGELIIAIEMLYLTIRINFRMSRVFDHGFRFGLGLWLFPFIFTFVLGFESPKYIGVPQPKNR